MSMRPEQNELMTRVGRGTPMGTLIRSYWIPALLSSSLVADEHPIRIRLVGEDLLAFRDSAGRIGIVSPECPHRGAPLYYGRNEEGGLRCVYHGWKFDVHGTCLEMPTEAPESPFLATTRLPVYRAREQGGVVWVWLGHANHAPELPAFEWSALPESHRYLSLRVQECNWVQALEGSIDNAHAAVLHGRIDGGGKSVLSRSSMLSRVKHPRMELMDSDAGVAIASLRQVDQLCYWRVSQFLFPFYTLIAPFEDNLSGQAWVPIDDETTLCFMFSYDPMKPLDDKIRRIYAEGHKGRESGHPSSAGLTRRVGAPFERYWPTFGRHNDFGVDWEEQRIRRFSGVPGLWVQDAAVQSGLVPIVDRSRQKFGTTDIGIVRVHRRLLHAAEQLQATGETLSGSRDPATFARRAFALNLAPGAAWKEQHDAAASPGGPVMASEPPDA